MNYILDLLGLNNLSFNEFLWVSFGTLGQLIFFSRWIIQWFYSEKSKISTQSYRFLNLSTGSILPKSTKLISSGKPLTWLPLGGLIKQHL